MANKVHSRVQLENRVVVNHCKSGVCEWVSGSLPCTMAQAVVRLWLVSVNRPGGFEFNVIGNVESNSDFQIGKGCE